MDKSKFSERLIELMFDRQVTVKKLSEDLELNRFNVHHWISDKIDYMPSLPAILKLTDYFRCSVDFLLGLNDDDILICTKFNKEFSKWFRQAVESKGFTLHRLGKELGMSTINFYKWINGEREPSLDSLFRISNVLGCSLNYLLGREE